MKIGISKGRIEKLFYKRLIEKNIIDSYDTNSRKYEVDIEDYEIYPLKSYDIIPLLDEGCIDIGILGSDIIDEYNSSNIVNICDFDTSKCSFMLATTPNKKLSSINTVATKYPGIAKELLKSLGLNCEIKIMNGSIEIAPKLNYADAIIDIVEAGDTLRANGLIELVRFNSIQTKIISKKENKNNIKIKKFIKRIG